MCFLKLSASSIKKVNQFKKLQKHVPCRNYYSENVFGYKRKVTSAYEVSEDILQNRSSESNFYRLVTAYRQHGHKYADINPVALQKINGYASELDPKRYGFHEADTINLKKGILNIPEGQKPFTKTVEFLNTVYTKYIGAEFLHLESEEEQDWFAEQLENLPNIELDDAAKIEIVRELQKCQAFETFLAKKFSSVKRYGGEGAETMITFFNEVFKLAAHDSLREVVLGMPHRGRLSLLTGLLNYPPVQMFYKIKGNSVIPSKYDSTGDILTHLIASTELSYNEKAVHVSLLYNPSHLEAVNPVSMGKTRAKHLTHKDGDYGNQTSWGEKVLNIQVHGDAGVVGQGINQETLNLTRAPNFEVGGSLHLVVNNQVGFTTPADLGRSSRYCTDIAKIIAAPVLHVNGAQPEEVLKVSRIAFNYQRKFRKEVFVDLNVFRKRGHNEMDDPTFTNPALYGIINSRKSIPDQYADQLVKEGVLGEQQIQDIYDEHFDWLNEELKGVDDHKLTDDYFKKYWEGFRQAAPAVTIWDSGVDEELLQQIGQKSVTTPKEFSVHPTIQRGHIKSRLSKVSEGQSIDWATAEAMAFGSLLYEGYNVRLSGEDVGRGTFSQRHAMLVDQQTNQTYIPLNNLHPKQNAFLEIANSILSEEAVIGFEYGMSIENPKNLIIWEAQFGDFFNGAQIIFDTFIASGEAKWLWQTGLTILLPHGYDGVGPDHSSARIERFLQLTDSKEDAIDGDNINMQVVHPSTPAQYFHLLRRQMVRNFRKPLIVIAPKTLLRLPQCVSSLHEMARGTYFKPVLGDRLVNPMTIEKVILTSGKHYYSLLEHRQAEEIKNVAIVRVESLVPFPAAELIEELAQFKNAKEFVWSQEEHQNGGSWSFVKRRFENLIGKRINYCGRNTLPTTAVGYGKRHKQEALEIIEKAFS